MENNSLRASLKKREEEMSYRVSSLLFIQPDSFGKY